MELANHISADQIMLGVHVKDKWELLERMAASIAKTPAVIESGRDAKSILEYVVEREKVSSTGVGGGYAFPHARIEGLARFAVCIAVLADDLAYDAIDGKPVRIACMIVTAEENPTVAIRVMGALAGMLGDEAVHNYFLTNHDPQAVYSYIKGRKLTVDLSISARDIMRPTKLTVSPDAPLRQVTREMFRHSIECVAVADTKGRIVGEITCDLLFKSGVPDFFNQLATVAFIRDFDPFEQYFAREAQATAADVMSTDFAVVEETATLMEIVFLLSVKGYPKVHVVRDGRKVGTIDRTTVLDRILNL